MTVDLQRFFDLKDFTQAAIIAHTKGKPFNPNGCRGAVTSFAYNENVKDYYDGVEMTFGDSIRTMNASDFIYTLNSLLNRGANIDVQSAHALGVVNQCSYTIGNDIDNKLICRACGKKHGEPKQGAFTFRLRKCGYCDELKLVCPERHFSLPKKE